MNITRRIHLNPQSKGSLGKSFEAEFRVAWLDWLDIPWTGCDLDDRHRTFADRHPRQVQSLRLGNEHDSKATLLNLFRRIGNSDAPVHIIDCRAQADDLILRALEELQILESLAEIGIRCTFFLFPSEDTESMNNLMDLFCFAGDRVDYCIVHNPAKVRTDLFRNSGLEAELRNFGAQELTVPVITPVTLLAIKRAEAKAGRKLTFAEVSHTEAGLLERMLAGEMQWAMQKMFPQYHAAANVLLPPSLVPKDSPWTQSSAKPPATQHTLNLGD